MNLRRSKAIKRGKARARKMGRLVGAPLKVSDDHIRAVYHLPAAEAADRLGLNEQWYILRMSALLPKSEAQSAEKWLAEARAMARELGELQDHVTIDEVCYHVGTPGDWIDPRIKSKVFTTSEWERVGGDRPPPSRGVFALKKAQPTTAAA